MIHKMNVNKLGICEYVCSTVSDIELLPTDPDLMGSTCLVISTKDIYILDGEDGTWKLL